MRVPKHIWRFHGAFDQSRPRFVFIISVRGSHVDDSGATQRRVGEWQRMGRGSASERVHCGDAWAARLGSARLDSAWLGRRDGPNPPWLFSRIQNSGEGKHRCWQRIIMEQQPLQPLQQYFRRQRRIKSRLRKSGGAFYKGVSRLSVQWATKVITPISIRNTWKQGSWLLWPTMYIESSTW